MLKLRSVVAAAGALIAMPLMGSPAWSAACVMAPVSTYTAPGFSCTAGPLTISGITVAASTFGSAATVALNSIAPFFLGNDFGLTLNAEANAIAPGQIAQVVWNYTVTSNPDHEDALLRMVNSTIGNGLVTGFEKITFSMTAGTTQLSVARSEQGSGIQQDSANFAPVPSLFVTNSALISANTGNAEFSSISNAFSAVPGPIVGAGLPGLIAALGGLVAMARRRRKQLA